MAVGDNVQKCYQPAPPDASLHGPPSGASLLRSPNSRESMVIPTMRTHGRLAAFGAMGVAAGCVALTLLLVFALRPSPVGGLDYEHRLISRLAFAVILLAVGGVHYAFGRQLLTWTRDNPN